MERVIYLLCLGIVFVSCKKGYQDKYGPFYVVNDTTVFMEGGTGGRIDRQFEKLIENYPNIRYMEMGNCPGSNDDDALVKAAKQLHDLEISIHLTSGSMIESGAVDLYLAGKNRTHEEGAKIGVHAWSTSTKSATEYPIDHSEHQFYIDYYKYVGWPDSLADSLYWFIITAAGPDEMHYLSESEIDFFQITTD